AWVRDHDRHSGYVERRPFRRGRLALPGAAPYGGSRLDPLRMGHQGYRQESAPVRDHRGGQETARGRRGPLARRYRRRRPRVEDGLTCPIGRLTTCGTTPRGGWQSWFANSETAR